MEKFKTDIYKNETGKDFDKYEILNTSDRANLIREIFKKINLNDTGINLFPSIENKLNYRDFSEEFTFDLKAIFKEFNFFPKDTVLVIWDEDHIDEINSQYLLDNWKYIWYGASDEAVFLYFKKDSTLFLITHYGRIFSNLKDEK